ncbi:hypothetical protein ACOKM5_25215 [Streptomyces sp. BH097]|uniref:hypothetical protein n=1 Tax=Streptomyces sp. BH097 TaxID=3410406 RepID=UPI003CEC0C28
MTVTLTAPVMNDLSTRPNIPEFIREKFEDTEEYGINLGPSQQEVADEFFGGDCRQALNCLRALEQSGHLRRVLSYGLYRWIPAEVAPKSKGPAPTRTEVTVRILDYVTREFTAGVEGNRRMLPSTRDVAKACLRGKSPTVLRRANRHLSSLEQDGSIVKIQDPDDDRWHRTYWALPDSGRGIPVAVTVSGPPAPLNRYGFTDEAWAAMKPWQRNSIRSIDAAELAPSSW